MKTKRTFQIVLIILIALFSADMVRKVINSILQVEKGQVTQNGNALSGKKGVKPFPEYSKIAERGLFKGATTSTPTDEEEASLDHPVTTLELILKGTVVGNKERSFAIIEDKKLRIQNLYHLNDSISSGITLSAIHTDRVVINRNGNKELLLMFQEDKKGGGKETRKRAQRREPPRTIKRQEIQEAAGDLKSLMRDVRIIPHFSAGKRDGFTVTYVRQGSRLQELGVQKNDIIKEINGTPAEEFRNIFEIFNKYSGADTLDLGIERDNQILSFSYTIE